MSVYPTPAIGSGNPGTAAARSGFFAWKRALESYCVFVVVDPGGYLFPYQRLVGQSRDPWFPKHSHGIRVVKTQLYWTLSHHIFYPVPSYASPFIPWKTLLLRGVWNLLPPLPMRACLPNKDWIFSNTTTPSGQGVAPSLEKGWRRRCCHLP